MPLRIEEWEWDEANIQEIARHGLIPRTVLGVGSNAPRFRRNRKGRAATHQMIGPDPGGTMWVVCILQTRPGRWRAVTGWEARAQEIEWYRRSL